MQEKTASQIFDQHFTFNPTRDPRSPAYKQGVLAQLEYKVNGYGRRDLPIPYKAGTAEWDAYYAGIEEANSILTGELICKG